MKASCSSTRLASAGATEMHALIDCAAQIGFQGITIDFSPGSLFSPDSFRFSTCAEIVRYAQAQGIEINSLRGIGITLAGQDEDELLKKVICLSHALACPLVTFSLPEREKEGDEYKQLLTIVRNAVEFAAELDICLAVEALADSWAATVDAAIDFVDDVDRLNIGIVYNPRYHSLEKDTAPAAVIEAINTYTLMILLAPETGAAIRDGRYEAELRLFQTAGFSEYVCDGSCCRAGAPYADQFSSIHDNFDYLRNLNILDSVETTVIDQ